MTRNYEHEPNAEQNLPDQESMGKVIGYTALFIAGLSIYACSRYGTFNPAEALSYLTRDTM